MQLSVKTTSSSSQVELENRLHTLTESLIQKQTMLEALSTEKNSLGLQLERLEVSGEMFHDNRACHPGGHSWNYNPGSLDYCPDLQLLK